MKFEFPTGDSDLQLDMQLGGQREKGETGNIFESTKTHSSKRNKCENLLESKSLEEFIDLMSAPALRSVKEICKCGCEHPLVRMSSGRYSNSCHCEKCNKCKRNKMFNYSRKFHKRFQNPGKSRRDTAPLPYNPEDIYTKVLSSPYNSVIPTIEESTLEKLLRLNVADLPLTGNIILNFKGVLLFLLSSIFRQ